MISIIYIYIYAYYVYIYIYMLHRIPAAEELKHEANMELIWVLANLTFQNFQRRSSAALVRHGVRLFEPWEY